MTTTKKKKQQQQQKQHHSKAVIPYCKDKKNIWKKWQQKKKKEMNKWMTQIKQKQGGTELQDILSSIWFIHYTVYYI